MKTTPTIYSMTDHPEVALSVSESATSASVYVKYYNTLTGATAVSRYSDHAKHAAPANASDPDYYQGYYPLTEDEVLYALGLKNRRVVIDRVETKTNLLPANVREEVAADKVSTLTAEQARNSEDLTSEVGKYIFVRKTKKGYAYLFVARATKESVSYYKYEYYN